LLESLQQLPGSDSYFSQPASGLKKVLHQTLIEVHTAADGALATVARASPVRPGNSIVPSCRPIQKIGLVCCARRSWYRARRGAEHTETEEIDSIMYGAGRGSNPENSSRSIGIATAPRSQWRIVSLSVAGHAHSYRP